MKYYYLKRHKGIFFYLRKGHRKYGYRYLYYDGNHKRHEKTSRNFDTQKQAISQRNFVAQQYSKNSKKTQKDITFTKWCNNFLTRLKPIKKITTYMNYSNLLKHDVIPYIGNLDLKGIKPMFYKYNCLTKLLDKGLSRKSVIDINSRVQRVMNDAVENGYLVRNQLAHTKIPNKNQRAPKEIMNEKELTKFNDYLNHQSLQLQAIYYTLEYTGMRAGELMGLKWKNTDLSKHLIHIKFTRDNYGIRSPKTRTSNRTIMIVSPLLKILKKYHDYCKSRFNITKNSFVILGKRGKPLTPNQVSAILRRLLRECGLGNMVGRFTPHSFRHMVVSRLIGSGVDPILVSKLMGHSSVSITLSIYAQSAPYQMLNMNKAFEKVNQHYNNEK